MTDMENVKQFKQENQHPNQIVLWKKNDKHEQKTTSEQQASDLRQACKNLSG